jgi:hypothetical protein
MVIKVKSSPSNEELIATLERDFSKAYSYREFGFGKKSVLVRKSALLGAQISVNEKQVLR